MAPTKHKKDNDLRSEERNIPIQKKMPVPGKEKKKKRKKKKLSRAVVLDNKTIKSPPTFSAPPEISKPQKKTKKKRNTEKSNGQNNLPLRKFFDSVSTENDCGGCQTLSDTKSFFKPEILRPEECVIQFAEQCISPKGGANFKRSKGKKDQTVKRPRVQSGDVHNVERVKESDLQINMEDKDYTTMEDRDHTDVQDTKHTDLEDKNHADVEDKNHADVQDTKHTDLEDKNHADVEDKNHADVEDENHADKKDKNHSVVEDRDHTYVEDKNHTDVEDVFIEKYNLQLHRLPENKFIAVLKHRNDIPICGQLKVRVLFGSVEILGWCANDTTDKSFTLFSPPGRSLLSLEPLEHSSENLAQLGGKLTALGINSELAKEINDQLDETSSLVLFEKSESTLISFLRKYETMVSLSPTSLNQFETILNCQIAPQVSRKLVQKSDDWKILAEDIADDFYKKGEGRVVVCGGKSVGKSVLLQYLVNRNVQAHGEVLYFDFDIGQPEFTLSGCVSVIRVTEPLLGPNFTHMRTPERSVFLGHLSVDRCPDRYIKGVKHIIDYCRSVPELRKMMWLVNTMGYVKGLGVELNTSVIGLVDPSRVVEIVSDDPTRNYYKPLLPENVIRLHRRWCKPPAQLDFKLSQLHSLTGASPIGWHPSLPRKFLILAYFHSLLGMTKMLSDVIPYRISLSRLTLSVVQDPPLASDVLKVMNGMLVALCTADRDTDVLIPDNAALPRVLTKPPICPCHGFGVVRGIDVESRTLYLTTPLPASRLSEVDCLMVGMILIPPVLLLNPMVSHGIVPYIAVGPGQVTSRLVSKKYVVPKSDKPRGS